MNKNHHIVESLQNVSVGMNDRVAGGVRELARNVEPITRVFGGIYIALGGLAVSEGSYAEAAGFGLVGLAMLRVPLQSPSDNESSQLDNRGDK